MTEEEARKIITVIDSVDGGCSVCAREALENLEDVFPDVEWVSIWENDYKPASMRPKFNDDDWVKGAYGSSIDYSLGESDRDQD